MRAGTMHRVTFASRLVPLLECGVLALALYGLASLLFGMWSGVVAALLWLFNPLVLGLGHLDGVDLPFALTTVLVSWALVRWLRRRDRQVVDLARRRLRGGGVGPDHRDACRGGGARRHRGGRRPRGSAWVAAVAPTAGGRAGGLGARVGRLHRTRSGHRPAFVGDPAAALCGGSEVPGQQRHRELARLPARRGLDGGERLVLARHACW